MVGLGKVDLFIPGLDVPDAPGGDDLQARREVLQGQLKAHLVVALPGAAMGDGVAALGKGDLRQALGDHGAGHAGAQKVVLVDGSGLHGGDDKIIHELVGQVLHIELAGPGLVGLLL